jgi:hypothetical protein
MGKEMRRRRVGRPLRATSGGHLHEPSQSLQGESRRDLLPVYHLILTRRPTRRRRTEGLRVVDVGADFLDWEELCWLV